MNIACAFGFHSWIGNGCKCKKCGKVRDQYELHDWSYKDWGCKCVNCGKTRNENHNWKGCECLTCGTVRDEFHDWSKDCNRCPVCGKTRADSHDWSQDCEKCSKCAQTRSNQHTYINDACSKCGKLQAQGIFTDPRDGKQYKWILFGRQAVMVQNFSFKPDTGNVCGDRPEKRGYLYDWSTATTVAPDGWHLPTKEEWLSVVNEFEKYCWLHFDQDTPSLIRDYTIRNGFSDFKGNNFSNDSSYYWSSSESGPSGAVGFCFPCWYNCASGDNRFSKPFDQNLGLSVIFFRNA